ncbi:MAG: hypothetical protein CM15mP49_17840 [Actinomycetota bacterium]|nr:MAG: hypothetical protein CM15mP49_17840 [Actinomycetota bacterium]
MFTTINQVGIGEYLTPVPLNFKGMADRPPLGALLRRTHHRNPFADILKLSEKEIGRLYNREVNGKC